MRNGETAGATARLTESLLDATRLAVILGIWVVLSSYREFVSEHDQHDILDLSIAARRGFLCSTSGLTVGRRPERDPLSKSFRCDGSAPDSQPSIHEFGLTTSKYGEILQRESQLVATDLFSSFSLPGRDPLCLILPHKLRNESQ